MYAVKCRRWKYNN